MPPEVGLIATHVALPKGLVVCGSTRTGATLVDADVEAQVWVDADDLFAALHALERWAADSRGNRFALSANGVTLTIQVLPLGCDSYGAHQGWTKHLFSAAANILLRQEVAFSFTRGGALWLADTWLRVDQLGPAQKDFSDELARYVSELDRENARRAPASIEAAARRFERDRKLTGLLKEVRGHVCQICGGSFAMESGGFYAECHHLERLSNGGLDVSKNMLVVCAQHHRQFHYGNVNITRHDRHEVELQIDGARFVCQLTP